MVQVVGGELSFVFLCVLVQWGGYDVGVVDQQMYWIVVFYDLLVEGGY